MSPAVASFDDPVTYPTTKTHSQPGPYSYEVPHPGHCSEHASLRIARLRPKIPPGAHRHRRCPPGYRVEPFDVRHLLRRYQPCGGRRPVCGTDPEPGLRIQPGPRGYALDRRFHDHQPEGVEGGISPPRRPAVLVVDSGRRGVRQDAAGHGPTPSTHRTPSR